MCPLELPDCHSGELCFFGAIRITTYVDAQCWLLLYVGALHLLCGRVIRFAVARGSSPVRRYPAPFPARARAVAPLGEPPCFRGRPDMCFGLPHIIVELNA